MVTVTEFNRKPDGSFATLEADTLVGADVKNAIDGTVPTSQGDGTLSMATIDKSDIGWVEDPNSPLDVSGGPSHTITLANNYDVVQVFVESLNSSTSQDRLLRVNENSTSDYEYVRADGSAVSSLDAWSLVGGSVTRNDYKMSFRIEDSDVGGLVIQGPIGDGGPSRSLVTGSNFSVSPPLDSLTFLGGSTEDISVKARVFGWDGGI